MSTLFTSRPARLTAILALALAATAGCGSTSNGGTSNGGTAAAAPSGDTTSNPSAPVSATKAADAPASHAASAQPAADWPSPEDCISYNPSAVTVHYEAGIFQVNDGSKIVMRLHGDPGSDTGQKGLALAQHYRRHCFIGRNNTRDEKNSYIFDYWRDSSGQNPTIADQEDDCSSYNRTNLTVEDMGDGNGWRVKDHDHVLQLFDNGTDARNGKLVLAKYSKICFIGSGDELGQDEVSYLL